MNVSKEDRCYSAFSHLIKCRQMGRGGDIGGGRALGWHCSFPLGNWDRDSTYCHTWTKEAGDMKGGQHPFTFLSLLGKSPKNGQVLHPALISVSWWRAHIGWGREQNLSLSSFPIICQWVSLLSLSTTLIYLLESLGQLIWLLLYQSKKKHFFSWGYMEW